MLGNEPFCQPSGEFHGLEETFSGSSPGVPHPNPPSPTPKRTTRSQTRGLRMNSRTFILIKNLVAFHDFAELPAGHHVSDGAVLLDSLDLELGDQLAVASDEQAAVFENALLRADVQHDKFI